MLIIECAYGPLLIGMTPSSLSVQMIIFGSYIEWAEVIRIVQDANTYKQASIGELKSELNQSHHTV